MNFSCICRPNTPVINPINTFQCFKCQKYSHVSCYEYKTDSIMKLFCIQCRLSYFEPFFFFEQILTSFTQLQVSTQLHETLTFKISPQKIEEINEEENLLALICTTIKPNANNSYAYEWPSENISISFNNSFLPYTKYSMLFIDPRQNQIKEINTITMDSNEGIDILSVVGVAIMTKRDIKEIARKIAENNPIKIMEEFKKRFDSLKNDDFEMLNEFPIKCPFTMKCMTLPARGVNCLHLSCFDLMNFLTMNNKPNKMRWKCPICRSNLPIYDLIIDLYLHQIIKSLKNQKIKENKLSFICFDENGNWKLKQNFSEEWDRRNKNQKNKNENVVNDNEVQFISSNLNDVMEIEKENINNNQYNPLDELIKFYNNKYEEKKKDLLDEKRIIEEILEDVKNLNHLKNIKEIDLNLFFEKTGLKLILQTKQLYLEQLKLNENYKTIEVIVKELSETIIGKIVDICIIWASSSYKLISSITVNLITSHEKKFIKLGIEILLVFSHFLLTKYNTSNIIKNSLFSIFGNLLNEMAFILSFKEVDYGKIFYYFSIYLPDFHFPHTISILNYGDYYEKLADFTINFLISFPIKNFIDFFCDLHLPPQDSLEELDDKRLAKHFIYFFIIVIKKKKNNIENEEISQIVDNWDKYNRIRDLFMKEKLSIFNINLDE